MIIGVIGPTNLGILSLVLEKQIPVLRKRAALVGRIIGEGDHELWVNSDRGMLAEAAKGYKKQRGKKLVALLPKKGIPWPKDHAQPYARMADKVIMPRDWLWTNYAVVSQTDICVVVGLSLGTAGELSYINWDEMFRLNNLKALVFIREFLPKGELPLWVSRPLESFKVTQYVDVVEDLRKILVV